MSQGVMHNDCRISEVSFPHYVTANDTLQQKLQCDMLSAHMNDYTP